MSGAEDFSDSGLSDYAGAASDQHFHRQCPLC
jgi:hypothetical protein